MNVLLWIVQVALALLYVAGGAYKVSMYEAIANQMSPLGRGGTSALGLIEIVGGFLLVVPGAAKWMPALTPIAAAVLAVETLGLAALYARHSLKLTPYNPLVWALGMGVLAAFIAWARFSHVASS